jgi:hypothetical protein
MIRSIDRHIHRHYSLAEIKHGDRCVACGAAARTGVSLDYAQGASTLYMKYALPEVPLCGTCIGAQRNAMDVGKRALVLAFVVPALLVVLVSLTTPLDTPLVIPGVGLAALVMARVVFTLVRRARALDARVLYIDGAEDQIILQLPPLEQLTPSGYRDLARDLRDDGRTTKMHLARVRTTLGFMLSTFATGMASLIGWFGAYPMLVIDDSSGLAATARIDGKRVVSFRNGRTQAFPMSYGRHTISFDDAPPIDVGMPFGENRLVTSDPTRCYQVRWRAPAAARTGTLSPAQIVNGRVIPIDLPDDVALATCPAHAPMPAWLTH